MKLCVFHNGKINSILKQWSFNYTSGAFYNEQQCLILDTEIPIEELLLHYYVIDNNLIFVGAAPSNYHMFNTAAFLWELPTEAKIELQSFYVNFINIAAQNKIFSKYPQTKQANLQARWSELVYENMLLGTGVLTNQNSSEGIAIRAVWSWIKDIRVRSNVATNAIALLSDENTIVADAELILENFKSEIATL